MPDDIHYPLASSTWDEKELSALQKVIESNQFSMGKYVSEFERQFADKFNAKYAIMVNSGSSANLLAIGAMCYKQDKPLQAGDEIIVPSLSWSTTYYPIHQYGMKLIFVDIDRYTLNLDVTQLEDALSEKTRAIFVPNILGNPASLTVLQDFCKKHHLYLLEDNCESMGAVLNGQQTGTFGLMGTYSTFFSHHMSTMEGGVVVTDDEELYQIMLALRAHGWTRNLPKDNLLCEKSEDPFYEHFRFILPGYNLRPLEMSGAIGIEQLKKLDDFVANRRMNAQYFFEKFEDDERFILQKENGSSSWFGFSLLLTEDSGIVRANLLNQLQAMNIEIRPVVSGNFLKNDVIKHLNHRVVGEHNNADYVHNQGFFVGNHQFDIKEKIDYFYTCIQKITGR